MSDGFPSHLLYAAVGGNLFDGLGAVLVPGDGAFGLGAVVVGD